MGFFDFLFGSEPKTMTGHEVHPDSVSWWTAPMDDGHNGPPPKDGVDPGSWWI